jgi:hypothetical protein
MTVTVWPSSRLYLGAGTRAGDTSAIDGQTDQSVPEFFGSFIWSDDAWATTNTEASYTWTYTNAGARCV